jgi:PKD repeat protein
MKKTFTLLSFVYFFTLLLISLSPRETQAQCNAQWSNYYTSSPDSVHFYYGDSSAIAQLWVFGDGDSSTAQYPWHVFPGPGTYTTCLTLYTATDTCTRCDTVSVFCYAYWTNSSIGGNPDSVHFTPYVPAATNQLWVFGDGDSSTASSPWHVFPGPGTYTVCHYDYYSFDTCSYCDTVTIVPFTCNANWSHYSIGNPDSVHFYYGATGALGQLWVFGDGDSSTAQYPWHVFPGSGTYTTCLTLYYSNDTCTHCDTVSILCNPNWSNYSISGNPDSVHFIPAATGSLSQLWVFGDGDSATVSSPWHLYPGPGTYTVCHYLYYSFDTCSSCDTITIAPFICNAQWNYYSIGNPDSVHFYPIDTSAIAQLWVFGDGDSSTVEFPWHAFPGPGTYTTCLTLFFANDTCTHCDTIIIPAPAVCNAQFAHAALGGYPSTIHFNPAMNNALSYHWSFGDNTYSTYQWPNHPYLSPGTYNACLTVYTSTDTCTWCDSIVIDSFYCNTHFAYYGWGNPDSLHFYPTGNYATSYLWDFGDSQSSTLQFPWHQFSGPGTYNVCLTSYFPNDTCYWCDSVTIDTTIFCDASFTYYYTSNPDSIHFIPNFIGGDYYVWEFDGGDTVSTLDPWYLFTDTGQHVVCLWVYWNFQSCQWCDTLNIGSSSMYFSELAENPALDEFTFYPVSTNVEVEKGESPALVIYPNPSGGAFNIYAGNREMKIEIYSSLGALVHQQTITAGNRTVHLDTAPGIYYLRAEGTIQKIVVY